MIRPDNAPDDPLPRVQTALAALTRRHIRIWVDFGVRIVAVAVLSAVLTLQVPRLADVRPVIDALSGMLVLWPLWTQLGRAYALRLTLGRAYAAQRRWDDAAQTLAPLAFPLVARLFDASGEGATLLTKARRKTGYL